MAPSPSVNSLSSQQPHPGKPWFGSSHGGWLISVSCPQHAHRQPDPSQFSVQRRGVTPWGRGGPRYSGPRKAIGILKTTLERWTGGGGGVGLCLLEPSGLTFCDCYSSLCLWTLLSISSFVFEIHPLLIAHAFRICESAYSLKFLCHPQMNAPCLFPVLHRHVQRGEKFER